jgi:AraC-like DNA-binding protein
VPDHIKVWRPAGFEGIELQRGVKVTRRVPPHWHDEYQLCLVHDGAGELFYRGVHHANPPWSLFVVHPGEVHSNRAIAERGCDFRTINAAPELLKQAARHIDPRREALPFFPSPVLLEDEALRRFARLHQLLEQPAARLERDALLLETLTHLVRRHAQDPPTPDETGREPQAASRVRDYLEAHFADEVPLRTLAALAQLSPYHLSRVFRRAFGLPPHAFQTQLRLARACRLLRLGQPLAAVAAETGFADQSHFTRRFKNVIGVTPGAYRKNVQDRDSRTR